jgi:large subunit ribosomal protein L14e
MSKVEKKTEGKEGKAKLIPSHFHRFVQIGRIVLVNYGPHEGKIGVIADVIDQNRALVTGPLTGVPTQAINFKRLSLTDFVIKIGRGATTKAIKAAFQKDDIIKKWEETSIAKKRAAHLKRANLNDFDRYKVGVLKRKKNNVIREAAKKLANWARPNAANVKARAERKKQKREDKKSKPAAEKKAKVEKKPEAKKAEKPAEKPVEKPAEDKKTSREKSSC